jgi:hypothetical protein
LRLSLVVALVMMLLWRVWTSLLLLGLLALMAILICRSRVRHVPFRAYWVRHWSFMFSLAPLLVCQARFHLLPMGVSMTVRQRCCVCVLIGMMAVCSLWRHM